MSTFALNIGSVGLPFAESAAIPFRRRPLQLLQGLPAFQQIPHQGTGHIVEPAENLRKIQFQAIDQTKVRARLNYKDQRRKW